MMQKNANTRELYRQEQLPVFQNRMYDSRAEAINCPKGDLSLVEDLDTGLAYNAAFDPVAAVIDINPAKQGKYLAATGLQVQSPEQALAGLPEGVDIYVMNPNYLSEIRELSGNKYNYIEVDKP